MTYAPRRLANPHRIPAKEAIEAAGYAYDFDDPSTQRMMLDSVVPACCDEGCEVEPDGRCEHGCPSVLLSLGLI